MTRTIATAVLTLLCSTLLLFGPASLTAAPTANNVKEVVDYYYNGQKEGPILTDSKLCKSIKDLECGEAFDPNAVNLGSVVNVWMQFFVPHGATFDDIIVEFKHEGVPRHLTAYKVKGSIRYRVADRYKVDKPGKWTITIKRGMTSLKEFAITVVKK
jgi:hypothetical protein